ncbi:hypothetical protein C8J56DRAFT_895944 [Mycena floridula]|nr:hypothetical protein C8J56DRAFT_895944 [Mycena floridula]
MSQLAASSQILLAELTVKIIALCDCNTYPVLQAVRRACFGFHNTVVEFEKVALFIKVTILKGNRDVDNLAHVTTCDLGVFLGVSALQTSIFMPVPDLAIGKNQEGRHIQCDSVVFRDAAKLATGGGSIHTTGHVAVIDSRSWRADSEKSLFDSTGFMGSAPGRLACLIPAENVQKERIKPFSSMASFRWSLYDGILEQYEEMGNWKRVK